MKIVRGLLTLALFTGLALAATAAPLFPDVPDNHWAQDAVRELAAKGLVEGYPDGTFKGDRAASRWETAMIVARLLARMERAQQTFASRSDLATLRSLTRALREELDALGVRVTALEKDHARLDQRVTELERITFYGSLESRLVMQSFSNQGVGDNDSLRNGGGNAGNVPFLNYNSAVGSAVGATRRPQYNGIFPVVDYRLGKALTNGTGFTSKALLGLNVVVTPDLDAGIEFSAFTAQGDNAVDAYWGVSAPWLSNVFTGNRGGDQGSQSLEHTPYTSMNLDRFWVWHKPSKTRLVVGEILTTKTDPLVFAGQVNLGVYGPRRWAGYGADVTGEVGLSEDSRLEWELFRTQFGDGNTYLGKNYQNYNVGGNLAYYFNDDAGKIQLNYVRTAEEASTGGPLVVGGLGPGGGTPGINVPYGESQGWSVRQWVNPPGYFAQQFSAFQQQNSGQLVNGIFLPDTTDKRPISGWNGTSDNAVGFKPGGGGGNFGPQAQDVFGVTGRHRWLLGSQDKAPSLSLAGDWGHSVYKPNKNSPFDSSGDAYRFEIGALLFKEALDVGVEYLSVDPNYAPASWFGNALGARFPRTMNFTGVWNQHDFIKYPHNREGIRLRGKWSFHENRGHLWAKAFFLEQKKTSLYDVRVTTGALGPGTPTNPVLGFSPGFVDPVFSGFASPYLYGRASGNSFTTSLAPMENPSGSENGFRVGGSYRWDDPALKLSGSYARTTFKRDSNLSPNFGGDQNLVNMDIDMVNLEVQWDPSEKLALTAGVDITRSAGHMDPSGLYHAYAVSINSNSFKNLDSTQTSPYLGLDYDFTEKTSAGLTVRYYDTQDKVGPQVRAGTALDSYGSSANPFDWNGWQVGTRFSMKF